MPSTLVHVAIAGLVGTALLTDRFDGRTIAVVLLAGAIPDLDTFVGLVLEGAHRSLFHTLLFPALLGGLLHYDTRIPDRSAIIARWGPHGARVGWVALAALLFGGILPDMFTNGVNALYPLQDAYYTIDGKLLLSNQRGIVQTFVDLTPEKARHSTQTIHYRTGVDPSKGADPKNVERIFPVVQSGMQLLVILLSAVAVSVRLWENRREAAR